MDPPVILIRVELIILVGGNIAEHVRCNRYNESVIEAHQGLISKRSALPASIYAW